MISSIFKTGIWGLHWIERKSLYLVPLSKNPVCFLFYFTMWQGNARMRNIWVHTGQRSFLSDSFKRSLVQCWWASWLTLPPLLHPHPYPPHYESQPSSTSPEAQTGVRDMFWPKHGAWEKSPEAKQGSELCMQGCKSITFQRAWGSQGDLWLGTPGSQSDVCKNQSCSNSNTGPAGFLEAVRLSKSCLGNHLCLFLAGFWPSPCSSDGELAPSPSLLY